jgi:small conductance mechanosensitive channel
MNLALQALIQSGQPVAPGTERAAFDLVTLAIRLGVIVGLAFLASRAAAVLIGRTERAIRREGKGAPEDRERRAHTIGAAMRGASWLLIIVVAALMGVRELGLDITPALAAAGGFGVAAGVGAQALVRDWLAGVFIIFENQFAVGDVIRAGGVLGKVEVFSLRHTEVRDGDGSLHFVPNGEMRVVTNLTKAGATPLIRIPVDSEEDPARAIQVLEDMLPAFREDPRVKPYLLDEPKVLGIDDVGHGQFTLLLRAQSLAANRWEVARVLRLYALERLRAEKVRLGPPR